MKKGKVRDLQFAQMIVFLTWLSLALIIFFSIFQIYNEISLAFTVLLDYMVGGVLSYEIGLIKGDLERS